MPGDEALKAELTDLRNKVTLLYQTESRLYKTQRELDLQLKIFQQLHELVLRSSQDLNQTNVAQRTTEFATHVLRYHRSLLLMESKQGLLVAEAGDGYDASTWEKYIATIALKISHPLLELVNRDKRVMRSATSPVAELDELAKMICLDEFIAFPMYGKDERLFGILIAGSSIEEKKNYVDISNELSVSGLANLSAQTAALIGAARSYHALREEEAERRTLEREIDLARKVQETILPSQQEFVQSNLRFCGTLIPAAQCSGDFWTWARLQDGSTLIALGDATGHGVASAMLTELVYGSLQTLARTLPRLTPADVLGRINELLCSEKTELWMTMIVGIISEDGRRTAWANAAHPPVIIGQPGARNYVEGPLASPLGSNPNSTYQNFEVLIEAPTRFLIYSDGLTEAMNEKGSSFGDRRLGAAFEVAAFDPRQCIDGIRDSVEVFLKGRKPADDVTVVALSIQPR